MRDGLRGHIVVGLGSELSELIRFVRITERLTIGNLPLLKATLNKNGVEARRLHEIGAFRGCSRELPVHM